MYQTIKEYIKNKPKLFDLTRKMQRMLGYQDRIYQYIEQNQYLNRDGVVFIQVGASDG